jgi:hypothetical protein
VWGHHFLRKEDARTTEQRRMWRWSSWLRISERISTGKSSNFSWEDMKSLVIQIPIINPLVRLFPASMNEMNNGTDTTARAAVPIIPVTRAAEKQEHVDLLTMAAIVLLKTKKILLPTRDLALVASLRMPSRAGVGSIR